jgi:hypothetical protein
VTGIADLECPPELARLVSHELSRDEERESPERDALGRWEYECSLACRQGLPTAPRLDEQLQALKVSHLRTHPGARVEPAWPGDRPFALCLSHDVDFASTKDHHRKLARRMRRAFSARGPRWIALKHAAGSLYRLLTEASKADPLGRFEEWLELEARYGFSSTFHYFPPSPEPAHVLDCDYGLEDKVTFEGRRVSVAGMMRRMKELGWEIGLHGSIESARVPGALEDQKRQLEEAIGGRIRSTRQHYLQYDVTVTPELQARAGLLCDSTMGFNNSIGFRASTSYPFWCWGHRESDKLPVLEVPLHIMEVALFRRPEARSTEAQAIADCLALMDAVERVGGCLTLNWHPNSIVNASYYRIFAALLEEAARRGAWGCSAGQLYEWWTARARRLGLG